MAEPLPQPPPLPPTDKDGNVYVRAADGTLGTVAPQDIPGVEASGGSVATMRDVQQMKVDAVPLAAKVAKVAAGDLGFWASGGEFTPEGATLTKGVASGATMGLSDLAGKGVAQAVGGDKLATQFRDTSNAFDAESPTALKVGEGLGMIAGSVAGGAVGGAGLAGRATLALPSAGISALGGAAEATMARLTAGMLARGALGRAGSTALQWAARGAVEGALMEGMHQTTDDLFQDHELAADKILMAAGKGGLYGAGSGFVMGGLGSLAKSGVTGGLAALRGTAASAAERAEGTIARLEGVAAKLEGQADDGLNAARKMKNAAAADTGVLERVERGTGEAASAAERKASAGFLERQANKQAAEALGGSQANIAAAAKNLGVQPAEAQEMLGAYLLRQNAIKAGDRAGDIAQTIEQIASANNNALSAVVKASGKSSTSAHMDDLYKISNEIYKEARMNPDIPKKVADIAGQSLRDIEESFLAAGKLKNGGKIALDDLNQFRKSIDKLAFDSPLEGKAGGQLLHDFRDRVEKLFLSKLDDAAASSNNPALRASYEGLKQDVRMDILAEKLVATGAKREAANRAISLSDTINAAAGFATGGFAGAAAGIGLSKMVRQHLNSTAAVALSRMAQRNAAEAALHTFDDVASRAASGMMKAVGKSESSAGLLSTARNAARNAERGYASGTARKATETVQQRARAGMAEVKRLQDPATMQAHVDSKLGTLRQSAPMLASAMAFRMQQTVQFLASKMPEETKSYAPISAPSRKQSINPVQAARFLRYQEAAENPQGCLDRLSRGEVRREDVEFMRECMPKGFETVQVRVLQKLTDAQAKGVIVPHEQRLKLSLLLDIKGDATLEPGMFRVLQKNVSAPPSGGAGGPQQGAPKRPVQLASSTQLTGMDKLEQ